MGFYIEVPSHKNKAGQLVNIYGAEIVEKPNTLSDVPLEKALICVVSNPMFDAAALIYSENELKVFADSRDDRPKKWLLMDREVAYEKSGYKKIQGRISV